MDGFSVDGMCYQRLIEKLRQLRVKYPESQIGHAGWVNSLLAIARISSTLFPAWRKANDSD